MKKPGGVKHVMDLMATVEAKNASMLSSIQATQATPQDATHASQGATVASAAADPAPAQSAIAAQVGTTMVQQFPATTTCLQRIMKKS